MTVQLHNGYRPRLLADIVAGHMDYYGPAWNFGLQFETKVATELAEFLERYDDERDLILSATDETGRFLGSITVDGKTGASAYGAHLRWYITTDAARATGLGRRLLERAIQFSDACRYELIYLTTFPGLDAARHLYQSCGFRLVCETTEDTWSGRVGQQRFERLLPRPAEPVHS